MREESISAKPVDILSTKYIRKYCPLSGVFCRCPHPSLGDRFTIFEPSLIEVFGEVME
jgi:hypothetical protein